MKVKICGIKDAATALKAVEYGADALGFVFAESKRKIGMEDARKIIKGLPDDDEVMKVGVFVNEARETIEEIANYCGLTHIQLHGDESPEYSESFRYPVIKAISINTPMDIKRMEEYETEYILLDSPKGAYNGGTGIPFDWKAAEGVDFTQKKVILAGGLNPNNVARAIEIAKPFMVDVSSGVETDGQKDVAKIKTFIDSAKLAGGIMI
ncbi:N-(5'-phosphoribosyl)anthranilate isomerase [Bacillus sp. FJAT-18017]|uniref:phosphoribosylanthranilate isomerase n=1 Tax=Bacillus sp. FJAT-18017 TaxID=1705566 RepID=UPI0006AEA414|nr:phosphoribosylanthranilate isomerase [Bacillus sp. FJAT-18017]ALC90242.1 N-(5'-phosphoribosyl)anthranilate isomerase [Bacillus sp. FJAT-18017]